MSTRTLTWTALGDSFTAGTGDLPTAGGWLARLARSADREVVLNNHAVPGATLDDVLTNQLPVAAPATVVSAIAGANDLLRYRFEPEVLSERLQRLLAGAGALGGHLVVSTCPDFFAHRHGPDCKSSLRIRALNRMVLDTVYDDPDRILLIDTHAVLTDRTLWHEDGLHPNPDGHHRLAEEASRVLSHLLWDALPTPV